MESLEIVEAKVYKVVDKMFESFKDDRKEVAAEKLKEIINPEISALPIAILKNAEQIFEILKIYLRK